jgi:hypothetical protein
VGEKVRTKKNVGLLSSLSRSHLRGLVAQRDDFEHKIFLEVFSGAF